MGEAAEGLGGTCSWETGWAGGREARSWEPAATVTAQPMWARADWQLGSQSGLRLRQQRHVSPGTTALSRGL